MRCHDRTDHVVSAAATATFAVAFGKSGRPRTCLTVPPGRVPRVARHLVLAHEIDRRVRVGELDDLAHAARMFGLTRLRVSATEAKLLATEVVS